MGHGPWAPFIRTAWGVGLRDSKGAKGSRSLPAQMCPDHCPKGILGAVLLKNQTSDVSIRIGMNLRAKKKAMWQEGLDIYICVCVCNMYHIYIRIYIYLFIYLFIYTHTIYNI